MTKPRTNRLAVVLLVIACAISGINSPVIRYALHTVPTSLFGFLRISVPLLIIAPIMLLTKRKRLKPKYIILAMMFGLIVYFVSNGLIYLGLKRTGAVNSAIIWLLEPLLMFSFSVEVMREKFNGRILMGIVIAFGGSMLVVFGPLLGNQSLQLNNSLTGNLLLVGAVIAEVIGTWVAKKDLAHIDKMQLLFWSLVPAEVLFGIFSFRDWGQIPTIFQNPGTRNAVLFGAVMNGIFAYLFSFYALKRIKGEEFGIFQYINPAFAAIVAVVFFGERFTPLLLAGVFVIFMGLYMAEAHKHKAVRFHV